MYWIIIISFLIILNFLLLKFSCNNCEKEHISKKPKLNMPEKSDLMAQPAMADK